MPTKRHSKVGWARDSAHQRFENQENSAKNLPKKSITRKTKTKTHQTPEPTPAKGQLKPARHPAKKHISNSPPKPRPKGLRKNNKRGIAIQKISASPPECVRKLSRNFDQTSIQNGVREVPGERPGPPGGRSGPVFRRNCNLVQRLTDSGRLPGCPGRFHHLQNFVSNKCGLLKTC